MDRTREFFEFLRNTSVPVSPTGSRKRAPIDKKKTGEYFQATKEINNRLTEAINLVSQLDNLVNGDNVFNEDDPKIQQLIYHLQNDISYINSSINTIDQQTKSDPTVHSITENLRRSLAAVTKNFQETVQSSTERMKKVQERRRKIGYVSATKTNYDTVFGQDDEVEVPLDQMAAVEMETMNERLDAVQNLERQTGTILKMFTDLSEMIAAKDYDIVRLDENVQNALDNVLEGQKQMEKYYEKVKNNKWFILKIFAVLFAFALIFILIM